MDSIRFLFNGIGSTIGAFGAHGLKSKVSNEDLIIFETGVRYQIYHSLALIILGLMTYTMPNLKLSIIGYLFTSGILLFQEAYIFWC